MSNQHEIKVGEIITTKADRDAIHMAIAPVIAGEDLEPGTHVGFEDNGTVVSYRQENQHVGIIDPFLKDKVKKGEQCWLFVYPKTIANLRHHWDHPRFINQTTSSNSQKWLEDYASKHGIVYGDMMLAVEKYVDSGCDEVGDYRIDDYYRGYETPPEFWDHFYVITGKRGKGSFWGCCI